MRDRDLFAELVEPTRKRGMKLYARILEGSGSIAAQSITNFAQVRAQDVYGQPTSFACWNNPDYRNWWTATVEDMFRSYQLDGLQWGAERHGPLMTTLLSGRAPFCFCVHCQARCQAKGINVDRARQGFTELCAGVRALQQSPPGTSGAFTGLLRVLLRYPEVLAWEYQYRLSREETAQAIYKTVKAIKPAAQVGWHVDHQQSSWDQVYRAEMTYGEMAAYSDFIKPIVYHDILAPRIRWWYLDRLQKSVLSEIPLDESLDLYYETFGYDRKTRAFRGSARQIRIFSGLRLSRNETHRRRDCRESQGVSRDRFRRPVERAALSERSRKRLSGGIEGLRRRCGWHRSLP